MGQGIFLVGTIGVGTTVLLRNEDNGDCDFEFVCKNCKKKSACSLPEAKEYREQNNNQEL